MTARRVQTHEPPEIVVTFDPGLRTRSGHRVRGLPAVFDVRRKRRVAPGRAEADVIARLEGTHASKA